MNAHIFLCAPVQLFICCVILLFIYLFLLFLCMGMSVCAFFCAILLLSTHTPFRLLSLSFSHLTHTLLLALDFSASRFDLSLGWFMWFFLLLLALFLIAYSVLLSFSECLLCCCCCRLCVSTRERAPSFYGCTIIYVFPSWLLFSCVHKQKYKSTLRTPHHHPTTVSHLLLPHKIFFPPLISLCYMLFCCCECAKTIARH